MLNNRTCCGACRIPPSQVYRDDRNVGACGILYIKDRDNTLYRLQSVRLPRQLGLGSRARSYRYRRYTRICGTDQNEKALLMQLGCTVRLLAHLHNIFEVRMLCFGEASSLFLLTKCAIYCKIISVNKNEVIFVRGTILKSRR